MSPEHSEPLRTRLKTFLGLRFSKIREINERYRNPRIKTGRGVSFALLVLRIYLLLLLGILFVKFIYLLH